MKEKKKKICPKILIVDDNEDHCTLLSDSLLMYYEIKPESEIKIVHSGTECLEQNLRHYDVILLDLYMPDMSGLEVLPQILDKADVPIIFVTGEKDSATAAEAIEHGAQDYIVKYGDYLLAIPVIVQKNITLHKIKVEHERLSRQLQWTLEELQVKNRQLEGSMMKLETMATTDPLTGLANRRAFNDQLIRRFGEAARYSDDLSCCMIDLDNYKQFNDTLGHQMGDELLCVVSEQIRSSLRSSDLAARYGGDEFVLLLPQTSIGQAEIVAKRLGKLVAQTIAQDERMRVPVTLSIGIASLHANDAEAPDDLLTMADRALYHAKENGRNKIVTHTEMLKKSTSETAF
ncbi:MAG: diguanylate cyclase [Phycisphaerae bacterium]|nr:diguanylate cyclase [Phycisphaerae bacterium]